MHDGERVPYEGDTGTVEAGETTEIRSIPIGDTALVVRLHPGSGGTAFVLVHGWGCSASTWDRAVALLRSAGSVVVIDLRGHGASPVGTRRASVPQFAADVLAVVTALELDDVVLIGHSMGGNVVTAAVLQEPRRIRGIVVIDPAYGADEDEMAGVPARVDEYRRVGGLHAAESVEAAFSSYPPAAIVDRVRSDLLRTPAGVLAEAVESLYLGAESFGDARTAERVLGGRAAPVLALYPSEARAVTERRVAVSSAPVTIRIAPVDSHFLHEEAPEWFARTVLDWATDAGVRTSASG